MDEGRIPCILLRHARCMTRECSTNWSWELTPDGPSLLQAKSGKGPEEWETRGGRGACGGGKTLQMLSGFYSQTFHLWRRPDLAKGPEEWNPMIPAVLVAVAGLFKYLADEYPPDLPEYDPV